MIALTFNAASRAVHRGLLAQAKRINKGAIRGLNRGAVRSRNDASREVRKILNVKAGFVKDEMRIKKATYNHPVAYIRTKHQSIPLSKFIGARQTSKGVTVKMRKDKPRKLFKHAFIAVMPTGHVGVYWRTSNKRLPIRELFGPTLYSVFSDKLTDIIRISDRYMATYIAKEIEFELKRRF